jgi:hypothetical protein
LKENKSRTTEQMKVEQQMSGIEHEPIKWATSINNEATMDNIHNINKSWVS